jgi:RNA polymerase sigma-70 factor (ECF subfamily)
MSQDDLYHQVFTSFGAAIDRLARSYEADAEKRRDLLQDIHFAVWRSLATFGHQCSLRTWVFRVAHNVAASHVLKHRRANARALVTLEEVETLPGAADPAASFERRITLAQLYEIIQQLHAIDREVMLLYLEGLGASSIAEVTGISPGNVATKVHRIKKLLSRNLTKGGLHGHGK